MRKQRIEKEEKGEDFRLTHKRIDTRSLLLRLSAVGDGRGDSKVSLVLVTVLLSCVA